MAVYMNIAKELESEVLQDYRPGDYLPSESTLAGRFAVNRHTVRRAVDELVSQGLVLRQQGKGNMVLSRPADYLLHSGAHYTANVLEQGSLPRCEVLQSRTIKASERIAERLGVSCDSKIIHIRTFRRTDGVPRALIDHYFADMSWWPVLKHFKCGSLHAFINKELGVQLVRKQTRVRAQIASPEMCRQLQINHSIPVLKINTINLIKDTQIVAEHSCSNTRSDFVELVMEH